MAKYEKQLGKGVPYFFGEELVETLMKESETFPLTVKKENIERVIERMNELNRLTHREYLEEMPFVMEEYWNFYRGGIILLGKSIGVRMRGTYKDYSVQDIAYILFLFFSEKNAEPEFIKETFLNMDWIAVSLEEFEFEK